MTYSLFNIKGVRVQPSCIVDLRAELAEGSAFFGSTRITKDVQIGRYTYATDAIIQNAVIGSFCSIAPGVKIGLNNHPLDRILTHPLGYDNITFDKNLPQITIGNDVWVGANDVILNGVSIGDGAVIAAGAVVNKNVNPFSIVGGIPAVVIGTRNKHSQFDHLISAKGSALKKILNEHRKR